MRKFQDIKKEENSFYKKFKKHLKKAIVGGIIGAVSLIAAPYILSGASDLVFSIVTLGTVALTSYGSISAIINGKKASTYLSEYEQIQEEKEDLFYNQEVKINNLLNENKVYQEKISNIKSDYKNLRNSIKSNINKDENNFKEEEIEYHKTL